MDVDGSMDADAGDVDVGVPCAYLTLRLYKCYNG